MTSAIYRILPLFLLLLSSACGIFWNTAKFNKFVALLVGILFLSCIPLPDASLSINWFSLGNLNFNFSISSTRTASIICSLISLILFCLHIAKNSIKHDAGLNKKFGLLHLFVFFMVSAVLADNVFQFFVSIEALGLISSLFVSFERGTIGNSNRTFMFNKFSSVMFLAGTVLIGACVKSFEFSNIAEYCLGPKVQNLAIPASFILISCFCKGAIFPFSFWLLDAVKANIFVSIIIHTSTIIAVGILFITKCYFLFEAFPFLKIAMIFFGGLTSLYMIFNALFHNNIKKIIACLTCCASGAMFVCCGIGEYSLAILYFIAHAFYKSMFFLSFLYVIYALSGEQNILRMGGINLMIPKISDIVWISFFASCGLPFLVNFFAKVPFTTALDLSGHRSLFLLYMFVNIIQIAAMFRLILISTYGPARADEAVLSRVSNANSVSTFSFWLLFLIGAIATFSCWSLYEWRELNFGYGGVVFVKQMFDYFIENVSEIIQCAIAICLTIFSVRHSVLNKNTKFKNILLRVFKCDYIYEYFINGFSKCFLYVFDKTKILNNALNKFLNYLVTYKLYNIGKVLQAKHTKALNSNLLWIILGILLNLLCFIYWRKF